MARRVSRVEVVSPGAHSTIQDHPGRLGFWEVGVPPSGPMDERSMRIANRLAGNPDGAASIEVTLTGPRLRFPEPATVAVTGAPLAAELDGMPVPQWKALDIPAGGVLRLGAIRGVGMRAYVAVRGGIERDAVMGSRSTFAAAKLGGETLRKGDVLTIGVANGAPSGRANAMAPAFSNEWTLRLVLGPHDGPEYVTEAGLDTLLQDPWTVHHQSDRTGIRLVGPEPDWARADGGDAGLHPSNILDSAYGIGTVMLAGDMAVVVGPDGPSLGGFVAIGQVIRADLWRLGQLRAGDRVLLVPVSPTDAADAAADLDREIAGLGAPRPVPLSRPPTEPAVLGRTIETAHGLIRHLRAGETGLLVEFGEPRIDLRSRVRVHMLYEALAAERPDGVSDLTPGVRSLHVQYDPDRIAARRLVDAITALERQLPAPDDVVIPARTVHLPLVWRDTQAMLAVERYSTSVRPDAPWCPDNVEFIRRINGLEDEEAVREIVFDASYLVLGLGDVYMGAPVAVPLDPRHRLVTTKYNPARTWTPENAVGIGGAFLCVYGTEGPGGYQLVGRTAPIWSSRESPPWRLRHFDQLRFHPVAEDTLEEQRAASARGEWAPVTEPSAFSMAEHHQFVSEHADAIARFHDQRRAAFDAERAAWNAAATGPIASA
jgi:urea carboxylase